MHDITWEPAFCGEGNACFRFGTTADGQAHIAVLGQEDAPLTQPTASLRALILAVKAGKADHLL
ncbi:hypothetical protein ACN20G_15915 [Streptomyces sp. BI20]|uniref:hypothetical protein n=1 Tax=Streptomyces sp. BI20 TaxID=3403460 RepID=UPI003C739926